MDPYQAALEEVMDMFESCGCHAEVTAPSSSSALLTIKGPVSMCPPDIFEAHVEKAKDLMRSSYPDISFRVEVEETP